MNVFDSIIQPQSGTFSPEHARYILSLDFPPEQHALYEALSSKASNGTLSEAEKADLQEFLTANAVLTILQSKARMALQKHNTAA